MPRMSRFIDYLTDISDGDTKATWARIADASPSSVTRWSPDHPQHHNPRPEQVIALARHYARPAVEALIAAGYLTARDVAVTEVNQPISAYSNRALLTEVARRMTVTSPADYGQEPDPDDYDLAAGTLDD